MEDSIQFSVTRLGANTYKIIVQDEKEIIRSVEVAYGDIMSELGYEIMQLKSRND